jgi:hypothetical protein
VIKGDLYFRVVAPDQGKPVNVPISSRPSLPIWRAQPWVDVVIDIPALSVRKTFTMLVDTGADGTVLSVRDAVAALGKIGYGLLQKSGNTTTSIGVGGSADYYRVNAHIIFQHEGGSLEGYSFELAVAKPDGCKAKRVLQLRIPSILGRDILCQFRMVMDYSQFELLLDH